MCARIEAAVFFQISWTKGQVKMAGMSDASREAAFVAFEAEFSRNG